MIPLIVKEQLESSGFIEYSKTTYVKKNGDLFYVLSMDGEPDEILKVYAAVWVPELQDNVDCDRLPKDFSSPVFGALSLNAVGTGAGDHYWTLEEIATGSQGEQEMLDCINNIALPWFCAFSDRKRLAQTLEELDLQAESDSVRQAECGQVNFGIDFNESPLCDVAYQRYSLASFLAKHEKALTDALAARGFLPSINDSIRFYRRRDDANIYDILYPRLIGFGTRIILDAFTWVPEFEMVTEVDDLPEDLMVINGGVIGTSNLIAYPFINEYCSIAFSDQWLDEVLQRVDKVAGPWFESITDRNAFLQSVTDEYRLMLDRPLIGNTTIEDMILARIKL